MKRAMPYLDLGGWPDSGNDALTRVMAVMAHPHDEARRDELINLRAAFKVSADHPFPTEIRQARMVNAFLGNLAGEVLLVIRMIAERHQKLEASVGKAALIIEARATRQDLRTVDGERKIPRHERTIRKAWGSFRSVAHLWAVFGLISEGARRYIGRDPPWKVGEIRNAIEIIDLSNENFLLFLAAAEEMRRWGEEHRTRQQEPTLPPAETWKVPERIELPEFAFETPPLSSAALDDLRSYVARVR